MTQSDSKRKSFGTKLRNKLSTLSEKISQAWKTIHLGYYLSKYMIDTAVRVGPK